METRDDSCGGCRRPIRGVGESMDAVSALATWIKAATSRLRSRKTGIFWRLPDVSSETHFVRTWSFPRNPGGGPACGPMFAASRGEVLLDAMVSGKALRWDRARQSARERTGVGRAAPRPAVRSAVGQARVAAADQQAPAPGVELPLVGPPVQNETSSAIGRREERKVA